MSDVLPDAEDIVEAAGRLSGRILQTPVLRSDALDERAGAAVLVKAENLQRGGSFKIRGALNRLLEMSRAERSAGVVAFSSGNHAQGVALAARWLGVRATIVMPRDAPEVKRRRTEALGARLVQYDRDTEDRESIAAEIAEHEGATLVPPFDHPAVIAGQGTVGQELARAARSVGLTLGRLYVPCGGGGLIAGCGLALRRVFPGCRLYAVEPRRYDDTLRSLRSGERQLVQGRPDTICDGLMAPTPGAITFAINRRLLEDVVTVDDEEVRQAMAFAAAYLKLVLEPSGAAALAAVLRGVGDTGDACGIVLSGGNVDSALLARVLADFPDP